jgi:ferredoxin-fold anticodon binding domain-containing protein
MFIDIHASIAHTNCEPGIWDEVINADHIVSMELHSAYFGINFVNGECRSFKFEPNAYNNDTFRKVYSAISEALIKGENCKLVLYP